MKWTPGNRSGNLEDRRGQRFSGMGRMGIGGAVVALVLSLIFGRDVTGLLGAGEPEGTTTTEPIESSPEEERMVDFVSFVLDSSQTMWARVLPQQGGVPYRAARLVLYRDAVQSACGFAQSATGPFYCSPDEKIYVDLGFFEELGRRLGAPGDFAQAYVLAHEIGHHVQNLLGTFDRVQRAGRDNEMSVRMELQADCYAGIWGHHAALQNQLESGDVEEGLNAAAAVGDDRITGGRVSPDAFTHGSSAQRASWFRRGLASGRLADCDTFSGR
jgi:predicted metalloprotease